MLEPAGAGARLTVRCRADSRGFFRLAEPLVIRLAKKQFETGGRTSRPSWKSTRSSEALGVGSSSGAYPRTHGGRRGRVPAWG
jgi:hypothetical protein